MPLVNNQRQPKTFTPPRQPTQQSGIPTSAPISTTLRSWQRRNQAAQQAGIPSKYLVQVARDDLKRVAQGRAPLTNTEAGMAVRARMTGKPSPIVPDQKDDTGFFGDVLSDVQDIGYALNPVKLIPTVVGDVYSAATHPGQTAEGLANVATGIAKGGPFTRAGTKDLTEAYNTPLVNWIPGLYTAQAYGNEGISGLLEHPLMTGLDVLPYLKGATGALTKAAIGTATLDDIATRGAAESLSRIKTLKPDVVDVLPESIQQKLNHTLTPLTAHEKLIQAGAEGKPVSALARLIAPNAMNMSDAGVEAFRLRMGMGPTTRYITRQHAIVERGLHAALKEQEATWLGHFKDLTDEEAQQALHLANNFNVNEVHTYDPKLLNAAQATRQFSDWMAEQSKQFPDMELTSVPLESGRRAWYGATGDEGKVASAYKDSVAKETAARDAVENVADLNRQADELFRAEQEARIAKLEDLHARLVAGRASSKAPARGFTGIAPLNNVFPAISQRLRSFVEESRSAISRRNLALEELGPTLTRYQVILDFLDNNPGATTREILAFAKSNLGKEELPIFAKYLEDNGISHVALKNGREVDVWQKLGVRKPGALRSTKPNPSAAARTLAALEEQKAKLANGSYVFDEFGSPEQRAMAKELKKLESKRQRAVNAAHDAAVRFREARAATPPASFMPMLEERIKAAVQNKARSGAVRLALGGGDARALWNLPEGIKHYLTTFDAADLKIAEPEYQVIVNDIFKTWQELDQAGYDPIWVHKVTPGKVSRELNPRIRGMANRDPAQLKPRSGQPTPSVEDIRVAVTAGGREFLEKLWHNQYMDDVILPYANTAEEVKAAVMPLVEIEIQNGSKLSRAALFELKVKELYTEYGPDKMFPTSAPKTMKYAQEHGTLYLPKTIEKVAKQVLEPKIPGALGKAGLKATSIFKTSVLSLSPKHMVNQAIADNMWLLMRGGREEWSIPRAIEMLKRVRNGDMPIELSTHIDPLTGDQLWNYAAGNKLAKILKDGNGNVRKIFTTMFRLEETVTNVQRMIAYDSELARGLAKGVADDEAHRLALEHVYKTVLDIDGLTPFERTIAKQVFPFYAFMRFLYNYVLTYPSDHPIRTAVIAAIARSEQADQISGLPKMWQDYFFIGQPDTNGNITAIDTRSLNPVRDLSNMFTFAGFVQQLNPLAGGALELMGVNGFTAAPELYPEMRYDPVSGRMVSQHKTGLDALLTMAQSVVPQVELGDYFLGMTERMRQLKATDKEAYNRVLYRNLFLPFTTRTVNIGEERQKVALARLSEAQMAVSDALNYGKSIPTKFKMVPYQGKIVPREYIEQMIKAKKQGLPEGAAPKATIATR